MIISTHKFHGKTLSPKVKSNGGTPSAGDQVQLGSEVCGPLKRLGKTWVGKVVKRAALGAGYGVGGAVLASLVPVGPLAGFVVGGLVVPAVWGAFLPNTRQGKTAGNLLSATAGLAATSALAGVTGMSVPAAALLVGFLGAFTVCQELARVQVPAPPVPATRENPLTQEQTLDELQASGQKFFRQGLLWPYEVDKSQALASMARNDRVFWASDATQAREVARRIEFASYSPSGWNEHLLDDRNRGLAHYAGTGKPHGLDPARRAVAEAAAKLRARGYSLAPADELALLQGSQRTEVDVQGPTGRHKIDSGAALLGLNPDDPTHKQPLLRGLETLYAGGIRAAGRDTAMDAYMSSSVQGSRLGTLLHSDKTQLLPESWAFHPETTVDCVNRYGPDAIRRCWHAIQAATDHGREGSDHDAMSGLLKGLSRARPTSGELPAVLEAVATAVKLHLSVPTQRGMAPTPSAGVAERVAVRTVAQARGQI